MAALLALFKTWTEPPIELPPTELHHQATLQDSAIEHECCPICFESLHAKQITVYTTSDGKRVCPHMFCKVCAKQWGETATTCPMCRQAFSAFKTYNLEQNNCFGLFDVDNSRTIDKKECTIALKVLLPYQEPQIVRFIEEHWDSWDKDGNNSIDEREFEQIVFAIKSELKYVPAVVPILSSDEWFDHWDSDKSNSLDINELTFALIHTFGLEGHEKQRRREEFIKMIPLIVAILDPDNDGIISKEEWPEFRDNLQANL